MFRPTRRSALAVLATLGVGGAIWQRRRSGIPDFATTLYATPLQAPAGALDVYHLGHSLVGQDMPAMLAQLAPAGHDYALQLGWGTSLKEHWEPELPINGFEEANDTPRYRPARKAMETADYDAVVLTEMVEIKDAIKYHQSAEYLARWTALAQSGGVGRRVYLYETWHWTDDGNGWLFRIDRDFDTYWKTRVMYPVLAQSLPLYLIPGGQVMAAVVREVEAAGGVGNLQSRADLFARHADGTSDTIHFNDLGAYLIALTHFAVLYHRDPVGLPHQLLKADGSAALAPTPEAAKLMQETVRRVVTAHPETGVATWA